MQTVRPWWLAAVAIGVVSALPGPASASHHVFSSSVDRFEVDGNVFGSAGGALDFVDEFDDGMVGPEFAPLLGTAVEAGGVLTLKNPGTDVNVGIPLDVSNVEKEDAVVNGAGDFTATTYWVPTVPATDTEFHFQVYGIAGVIEAAGLQFGNMSAAAAAQSPGSIAGPSITASLTRIDGTGFHTPSFYTVAVNPAAITGRIVFRLSFDDATDMLTGSYSLDDGATFQSFPPVPIFDGLSETELILGAGGASTPGPPPPPPGALQVRTLLFASTNSRGNVKLVYKVKDFGQFIGLPFPTTNGATFNAKLDGVTQCFHLPASGWSMAHGGRDFNYADPTGAHGAVKSAKLSRSINGTFKARVVALGKLGPLNISPPNPGQRGDAHFRVTGGTALCGSTAGGIIVKNDNKAFKVKEAPAPASCQVAACSPSGAFLDPDDGGF
jgi:hypothetical protein